MPVRRGLSRGSNLGVILLAANVMNFGVHRIPPATLALIAAQVAIFLEMFPKHFPSANGVCISSYLVYHHRDWQRLILGALYHATDMHLYFNMISLLYKGTQLEKRFGTPYFIYLVGVFTVLTSVVYVGLGLLLKYLLQDDSVLMTCAVGFSGVLFALKVLTTHYSPSGLHYVLGFIPVPSKHIYWVELLLIQILVPNASFVGHLAGILVGVAYIWGPLKFIMDIFFLQGGAWSSGTQRTSSSSFGRGTSPTSSSSSTSHYFNGSRAAPSAPPYDDSAYNPYGTQEASRDYYTYTGGLNEDEQYQRAVHQSVREQQGSNPPAGSLPNLDDLRSRRAQYYQ